MEIDLVQYINNIKYEIKENTVFQKITKVNKYVIDSSTTPNSIDLKVTNDDGTFLTSKLVNATMSSEMNKNKNLLSFDKYKEDEVNGNDDIINKILTISENQAITTEYLFNSLKTFIPSIKKKQIKLKNENKLHLLMSPETEPEPYKENSSMSFDSTSRELFVNTSITDKFVFSSNHKTNNIQKKSIRIKHNLILYKHDIQCEILSGHSSNKNMNTITFGKKKKKTYVCIVGTKLKWYSESEFFSKLEHSYNLCKTEETDITLDTFNFSSSSLFWTGEIFIAYNIDNNNNYIWYSRDGIQWYRFNDLIYSNSIDTIMSYTNYIYRMYFFMDDENTYILLYNAYTKENYNHNISFLLKIKYNLSNNTCTVDDIKYYTYIDKIIYIGGLYYGRSRYENIIHYTNDIEHDTWKSVETNTDYNITDCTQSGNTLTVVAYKDTDMYLFEVVNAICSTYTKVYNFGSSTPVNSFITTNGTTYVIVFIFQVSSNLKSVNIKWTEDKKTLYDPYIPLNLDFATYEIKSLIWDGNMFIVGLQKLDNVEDTINCLYSYNGKQWFLHEKESNSSDCFEQVAVNTLHKNTIHINGDTIEINMEKENNQQIVLSKNDDLEFITHKNTSPIQVNIFVNQRKYHPLFPPVRVPHPFPPVRVPEPERVTAVDDLDADDDSDVFDNGGSVLHVGGSSL